MIRIWFSFLMIFTLCAYLSGTYALMNVHQLSPTVIKDIMINIKMGKDAESFTVMIDQSVMKKHLLDRHEANEPYFWTNDRLVLSDILTMVLEKPDGYINDTQISGMLKIYRKFDYPREIKAIFEKEKNLTNKLKRTHVGQTNEGPTNQVEIVLKVTADNHKVLFVDAYPIKAS